MTYSPDALRAQLEKVIDAACDAEMKTHGWVPDDGAYHSTEFSGHIPYRGDAVACAGVYIRPNTPVSMPPPGAQEVRDNAGLSYYVDAATSVYEPWEQRIKALFEGWDELPLATDFEPLLEAARGAVAVTTLEAGSDQAGGDLTADGELGRNLQYVYRWISPDAPTAYTGVAIGAFDYSYGAGAQQTVICNQRQAMIAIGLCLAGAQNLWLKTGEDIMTFATNAETAFANLESPSFDLGLVTSFVDVLGLFAVGPLKGLEEGLKVASTVIKGVAGAKDIFDAIVPKDEAEKVDPALSGGTPEEVASNIESVLSDMATATWAQEKALIPPLTAMKADMFSDPHAYHIHPEAGVDPDLAKAVEMKVDAFALNKALGTAMPIVAAKLAQAAGSVETASSVLPWLHPYNVGYGTTGANPELAQLCTLINEVCLSTGQELLTATKLLARALGVLDEVDESMGRELGDYRDDLRGHRPRFPDDPGDPRQPRSDYYKLPNGKPIPIG